MEILKEAINGQLRLALKGRLDTVSAPQMEKVLQESLNDVSELVLDFADLAYISSAGLRVILSAQKTMNKQGRMKVCRVNQEIMEIFDMTGFSAILTIE